MKKLLWLGMVLVLTMVFAANAAEKGKSARTSKRGKVVHMVCFKFKADAGATQVAKVEEAFCALKKKIPQIVSLEWGTNMSPEKLDKGFTHGYVLTFKSDQDRDAYLVHPDHKAFGAVVGPVLADVFVLDFVNRN